MSEDNYEYSMTNGSEVKITWICMECLSRCKLQVSEIPAFVMEENPRRCPFKNTEILCRWKKEAKS